MRADRFEPGDVDPLAGERVDKAPGVADEVARFLRERLVVEV